MSTPSRSESDDEDGPFGAGLLLLSAAVFTAIGFVVFGGRSPDSALSILANAGLVVLASWLLRDEIRRVPSRTRFESVLRWWLGLGILATLAITLTVFMRHGHMPPGYAVRLPILPPFLILWSYTQRLDRRMKDAYGDTFGSRVVVPEDKDGPPA